MDGEQHHLRHHHRQCPPAWANRFPYSDKRIPDRPDFELLQSPIIGENKIVNDYDTAVNELKDYLKNKGFDEESGIAT